MHTLGISEILYTLYKFSIWLKNVCYISDTLHIFKQREAEWFLAINWLFAVFEI